MTSKRNRAASRKSDCKKIRYRDQREAKNALISIKRSEEKRADTPVRAYLCPLCNGWHLTHQPM